MGPLTPWTHPLGTLKRYTLMPFIMVFGYSSYEKKNLNRKKLPYCNLQHCNQNFMLWSIQVIMDHSLLQAIKIVRHKCTSPFHVTHHGCHLKNNLGSLRYEHRWGCKTWWWGWTYPWKCTPSHNSFFGGIGTLVPTTNKTFLCLLKHKA